MLQVEVTFCDKNTSNDEGLTLQLSLKMKYDEFARRLGAHLNYDHEKIQFFRSNLSSGSAVTTTTAASVTTGGGGLQSPTSGGGLNHIAGDLKAAALSPFAIKYNPELTLRDAFLPFQAKAGYQQQQPPSAPVGPKRLYYQKLNIKVFELEERRPFRLTWISANLKVERELCPMPFKKVFDPVDLSLLYYAFVLRRVYRRRT